MSHHSSRIIRANQVEMSHKTLVIAQPKHPAPEVTVHRQGNVVQSIEIRCQCGEQLILDCVYADDNVLTT